MQRLGKILHRRDKSSRDEPTWSPESVQPPTDAVPKPALRPREERGERAPRSLRPLPRRDTRSSIQSNSNNVSPVEPPSPSAAARAAAHAAMSPATPRPLDATEQQLFQDFGHMSVNDGPRRGSASAGGPQPTTYRRSSAARVNGGRPTDRISPPRRKSPPYAADEGFAQPSSQPRNRQHSLVKKASLNDLKSSHPDKPLPKSPSDKFEAEIAAGQASAHTSNGPNDLSGIVDLTNTEDTSYHKQWAPVVTHETITQNVHEVRQEQITREIHTHDVYHRILPVIDFEVLPARHFVPVEGGYVEISADEVPGGAGDSAQKLIQQALANVASKPFNEPIIPTRFSARSFEGTDGDYREYTTADGIKRTEQWWVHPPTMVNEAIDGAEVDFVNTKTIKGALRPTSPAANVVGLSPLLAQQRGARVHSQKISTAVEVPLSGTSRPGLSQ